VLVHFGEVQVEIIHQLLQRGQDNMVGGRDVCAEFFLVLSEKDHDGSILVFASNVVIWLITLID